EVNLELPWPAYLPRDYVDGQRLRIEVYRRLARIRKLERLRDFEQELRDRFGPLPEQAEWLLRQAEGRLLATPWQVDLIAIEPPTEGSTGATDVVFHYRNARRVQKLAQKSGGRIRVVDDRTAYWRPTPAELEPLGMYEALRELLAR